jgi:thioredoxin 1
LADIADMEAEAFEEAVKGSEAPVVLEFWIRSCDNCRRFKPVYERLPEVYGGRVKFARMNLLKSIENLRLAEGMGVEKTPTTKVFCGGVEAGELVGFKPFEEAVDELNSILQSSEMCGP